MSRHKVMTSSSRSNRTFVAVLASALFLIATASSASAAIGVSSFTLTPTTTVTAANPDLSISATRSGTSSDDVRTALLKLPVGASYSISALATKCSSLQLSLDSCPAASKVGTAAAQIDAGAFGSALATGDVFASGTGLGIIYRPSGFARILVRTTISGTPATGVTLSTGDYKRTANLLGIFPVDITIQRLDFLLRGKSGTTPIITNPDVCGPATSTFTFASHSGTSASRASSFTVSGCAPAEEKPVVTITAGPAAGSFVSSSSATFEFASATAGVSFECKIDAGSYAPCVTGQSFDSLSDGSHTFAVRAKNGSTYSDEVSRQWTVDTIAPAAPELIRTAPSTRFTNTTSATLTITGVEPGATTECFANAGPDWLPCSSPIVLTDLADGNYDYRARVKDAAGNVSESDSVVWSVDTIPPETPTLTLAAPETSPTSSQIAYLVIGGLDIASHGECSTNGGLTYTDCGSWVQLTDLADGTYTYVARAEDRAGNVSGASNSVSWVVDTTPPDAPMVSTPPSGTSSDATITFSGESGAVFRCSLDNAEPTPCTSPWTITFEPGSHSFSVFAIDEAGNAGSATTVSWMAGSTETVHTSLGDVPAASPELTPILPVSSNIGTSFECRVNDAPANWATCEPNEGTYGSGLTFNDGETNMVEIRAVSSSSGPDLTPVTTYVWTDTRSVEAHATISATDTRAGAHPDLSGSVTLDGGYNPRSVKVDMPVGLNGALTATSEKCDASGGDAEAMDCAASAPGSAIGEISGVGVATTAGTITDATSTIYLTTPPADGTSPAGVWVDVKSDSHPEVGHIRTLGWVNIVQTDTGVINGEVRQSITIPEIPERTSNGTRFHINAVSMQLLGDPPGGSFPLVTNPTTCDSHSFVGTGSTWSADGLGDFGPDVPEVVVDYPVTDCDSLEFDPQFSQDFFMTNPIDGSTYDPLDPGSSLVNVGQALESNLSGFRKGAAGTVATVTNGSPSTASSRKASIRSTTVLQPQGTGVVFESLSGPGSTCPGSAASPTGIFDQSQCSPGAQVGTVSIETPLLEEPLEGTVWLINYTPLPWLGISINPDTGPNNPAGVNLALTARTDLSCAESAPQCSDATYKRVTITLENLPDVPMDSVTLDLSGRTARALDNNGEARSTLLIATPDQGSTSCLPDDNVYSSMSSGDGTIATAALPTTMGHCSGFSPPTLTRTSPAGSVTNQTTASFTVVIPDIPGATLICKLDQGPWEPCSPGVRQFTGLADGQHTFSVRSVSADGTEASNTVSNSWTVDTVPPPSPTFGAPTFLNGTLTVPFSNRAAGTTFWCKRDASTFTTANCGSPGSGSSGNITWPGIAPGSGSHTLSVQLRDAAGNISPTQTISFTA